MSIFDQSIFNTSISFSIFRLYENSVDLFRNVAKLIDHLEIFFLKSVVRELSQELNNEDLAFDQGKLFSEARSGTCTEIGKHKGMSL